MLHLFVFTFHITRKTLKNSNRYVDMEINFRSLYRYFNVGKGKSSSYLKSGERSFVLAFVFKKATTYNFDSNFFLLISILSHELQC